MSDLEVLQIFSKLCCLVFQHTKLRVLPTWCHTSKEEDNIPERIYFGWQNSVSCADISLEDSKIFLSYFNLKNPDDFELYEVYDILEFFNNKQILEKFIELVNSKFVCRCKNECL